MQSASLARGATVVAGIFVVAIVLGFALLFLAPPPVAAPLDAGVAPTGEDVLGKPNWQEIAPQIPPDQGKNDVQCPAGKECGE